MENVKKRSVSLDFGENRPLSRFDEFGVKSGGWHFSQA